MAKKKAASKSGDSAGDPEISFEESLEEVERIIERIESGEVGLEDSIGEYERGSKLIARCRATLERAEQRIRELNAESQPGERSGD